MSNKKIKIGVVDDSPTFIKLVSAAFNSHDQFDVIWCAQDALDARKMIAEAQPDVLTLDVAMPGENGLELLTDLMHTNPFPIIMVSSLTGKGAEISLEALKLGALGCVLKPRGKEELSKFHSDLRDLAGAAIGSLVSASKEFRRRDRLRSVAGKQVKLIGVAASTGGIKSLDYLAKSLPLNGPPILITQHLQPEFIKKLAARMNSDHDFNVAVAANGERLEPGTIRFAPPGYHLGVKRNGDAIKAHYEQASSDEIIKPAADNMFLSIAEQIGGEGVGIILSGMGKDGGKGLLELRKRGGLCVGESEATCTVYGMPKYAKSIGAVEFEKPAHELGNFVSETVGFTRRGPAQ